MSVKNTVTTTYFHLRADRMKKLAQPLITTIGLILAWDIFIRLTHTPPYLLPPPLAVAQRTIQHFSSIAHHTGVTALEIFISLIIGNIIGIATALALEYNRHIRQWLHPLILISQAIPVYALGPLLMLWFGYGLTPKIIIAVIIIFFPITTAAYDGLRNTPPHYLALAQTMNASKLATLIHIRLPAALPTYASGIRTAAVITPIATIIGEYVGGSQGLGYLMQYGINRSQVDLAFSAVIIVTLFTLLFYTAIDKLLNRLIKWA